MLAYTSEGHGNAVVLLHGFPLNRSTWDSQVAHLESRYRVIAPDLPGLGASAPVTGVTMEKMAQEVLALLDRLGIQKAAVAGHSMGGYVTLALQKLAPERVAGIGLICTQAQADTPEAREGRYATAEKVKQEGSGVVAAAMGPKLFAEGFSTEHSAYKAVMAIIRQSNPEGVQGALHAMAAREDHRPRLSEITVPALVLTSAGDRLIPPDRSEAMAAALPNASLVVLPGVGHMPMQEAPGAVNEALSQWLARVYA